ncbi:EAL domain-containing protein [Alteromonas sediminis]|uniref:EAL domain-containing protein n=1 Tax=Alteromonas sediminis TaxID=2259342 RepID=A0A3N5XY54_9ALTE|nr:EAL domain-containing protein [Alteromonas sediminis]RPJ65443.1 EAL domain-containing protein [Alteromonas sediminis]
MSKKNEVTGVDEELTVEELRALIPQLQQLTDKYKRAERIQKALLDISELASTVSHLSNLYPAIHEIIGDFMNADNFYVAFYDKSEDTINFAYFVDEYDEQTVKQVPAEKAKGGVTGYILKSGNNLVFRKNEVDSLFAKIGIKAMGEMPEHLMGVPLKRGKQTIGAMVVQTYDPKVVYTPEDLEVFSFVSQHIVTTVDRVKRSELTERTIRERTRQLREINDDLQEEILERQKVESLQQALFEISELAANLEGDMNAFYSQLHDILARLISAPNCYIAKLDESGKRLEFPYFSDTKSDSVESRRLGLGLTELVLRKGQAELVNPARVLSLAETGELDVTTAQDILKKSTTWLGSPLVVDGEIEGVIAIQSYGTQANYSNKDLELLKFVSHHIASAMERKKRTKAIQKYNQELEERVKNRTEELDNANQVLKKQIEERKEIELKLIHDAHHDSLTDLPNRAMFNSRLELAIASKQRRADNMYAVLFIDLDRFKLINDTLGHHAGDEFLIEVSKRIAHCIRGHDLLARLGGDEFVVLLDNFEDSADVEEVAARIIDAISKPFSLDGKEMYSGASIGIAHVQSHYRAADEVLRDADAAMYQAKTSGRGNYVMFDQSMRERLLEEMEMEAELRKTMRSSEFGQFVQPILSLSDQTPLYHEFYLRWEHPQMGAIAREQFRQVAEHSGLTLDLDMYQLKRACEILKSTQDENMQKLAVNVSITHLLQASLVNKIIDVIEDSGVSPSKIVFEFDENDLNRRSQFILPAIKKLKRAGVTLVLDNFGSGLASLSYLFSYPFDYIKIDHRFIKSLPRSQRNLKLIQSIMLISEHLHFDVIADGITSQSQLDALSNIGCRFGQGKLIASSTYLETTDQDLLAFSN